MDDELFALIDQRLNWRHPSLASLQRRRDAGEPSAELIPAVIAHLRRRRTPNLGYSRAYVEAVRSCASDAVVRAAQARWQACFDGDLVPNVHNNAFATLGAESIIAAATPTLCRQTAAAIIAYKPSWDRAGGAFGPTRSLCKLLSYLFPLEACADRDLIPILCWLLVQSEKEWQRARNWDDAGLGNSGHNWWTHALCGMWLTHVFFPEFSQFNKFSALFPTYLERELKLLFHADGWSKEGAVGYHQHGAMMLQEFAWYAALNGLQLTPLIKRRLEEISSCQAKLLCPTGDFPDFHDDCRRLHALDCDTAAYKVSAPGSFATYLRAMAARYGFAAVKYMFEQVAPDWRPAWPGLLPWQGRNYYDSYRQLRSVAPVSVDATLVDGGYYVMRNRYAPDGDYLAIHAGVVGPLVTSHKHVDIFNMILFSRGRAILVDNGYGDCPEMAREPMVRRWRVGSSAHNVATVDHQDQIEVQKVYRYAAPVLPLIDDWRSERDYAYFSGAHEGYQRLAQPVPGVRRKIFYLRDRYWILIDRFTCDAGGTHDYQLHFHLNVPSVRHADGRVTTTGDGGNLAIVPLTPTALQARIEPCPYPLEGYANPDHLVYEAKDRGNAVFVTLLVPYLNDDLPAIRLEQLALDCADQRLSPHEATALKIDIDGRTDYYVDLHKHWNLAWQAAGHRSESRLWHSAVR